MNSDATERAAIEETAKEICRGCANNIGNCKISGKPEEKPCTMAWKVAEHLYREGYARVKKGTWKIEMTGNGWNCWGILTCSVCGVTFEDEGIEIALDYCPKCGARMQREEQS